MINVLDQTVIKSAYLCDTFQQNANILGSGFMEKNRKNSNPVIYILEKIILLCKIIQSWKIKRRKAQGRYYRANENIAMICKRVYMLSLSEELVINNLESKNTYEYCYNVNHDTLLKADYFLR